MDASGEEKKEKKLPTLPPCKICGKAASGFHYGINSCGACKGFFLRSLARTEPYVCLTNGQCNIGPDTARRKSCQKCRFDKCLRLGMSKSAIKIGRYTYSKRTQDTLELKQLKGSRAIPPGGGQGQVEVKEELRQFGMDKGHNEEWRDEETGSDPENSMSGSGVVPLGSNPDNGPPYMSSDSFVADLHQGDYSAPPYDYPPSYAEATSQVLRPPHWPLHPGLPPLAAASPSSRSHSTGDRSPSELSSGLSSLTVSPHHLSPTGHHMGSADATSRYMPSNLTAIHSQHEAGRSPDSDKVHMTALETASQFGPPGHSSQEIFSLPRLSPPEKCVAQEMSTSTDIHMTPYPKHFDQPRIFTATSSPWVPLSFKQTYRSNIQNDGHMLTDRHGYPADPYCSNIPGNAVGEEAGTLGPWYDDRTHEMHQQHTHHHIQMMTYDDLRGTSGFAASDHFVSSHSRVDSPDFSHGHDQWTEDNQPPAMTGFSSIPSHGAAEDGAIIQRYHDPDKTFLEDTRYPGAAIDLSTKRFSPQQISRIDPAGCPSHNSPSPSLSRKTNSQSNIASKPTAPPVYTPNPDQPKPWSSEFSETELDSCIRDLVSYHNEHVVDNNTLDGEQLKEKTDVVYNHYRLEEKTFGELGVLDRELYFEIYKSTGLDVDGRETLMSSFLHGIHSEIASAVQFFRQIPGFKTLPIKDQAALVKGCAHEFHILGLYRGWDDSKKFMTFIPLGAILREQDLKKVFPEEAMSLHIKMMVTLQKLNLTMEQAVILKAIVATSPDRGDLEAEDAAAKIHWKLMNCLLMLLWQQGPEPLAKFSRIMSVLTEMRTYSIDVRTSYTNIRSDVEQLTGKVNIPFIFELFF